MKTQALLYYIGAFIFGGLGLMTFLQLEKTNYKVEAGAFIIAASLVYYGMVTLYFKVSKNTFILATSILSVLALCGIFFNGVLFGSH
jgi:hypothetical protein